MPIFSILFIIGLILGFFKEHSPKDRFFFLVFFNAILTIYLLQGYFLKVGVTEITSPRALSWNVLFLYALYVFIQYRIKINRRLFFAAFVFFATVCLSCLYEMIMPYDGLLLPLDAENGWDGYIAGIYGKVHVKPSYALYARAMWIIVQFILVLLIFKQLYTLKDIIQLNNRIIRWAQIGIVYGFVEFFIKNVMGNVTVTFLFSEIVFGTNKESVYTEVIQKGGLFYSLQGFTREPSHYIIFLWMVALFILVTNLLYKKYPQISQTVHKSYSNWTLLSCIILLGLTGGFSAVWALCIIILVGAELKFRESGSSIIRVVRCHYLAVFFLIIAAGAFSYYVMSSEYLLGRLEDAIVVLSMLLQNTGVIAVGNEGIGSTIARFTSIVDNLFVFLERPLLGLSPGVQWAHDTTVEFLVGYGILGAYTLYRLLITSRDRLQYDKLFVIILLVLAGLPMKIGMPLLAIHYSLLIESTALYMAGNRES